MNAGHWGCSVTTRAGVAAGENPLHLDSKGTERVPYRDFAMSETGSRPRTHPPGPQRTASLRRRRTRPWPSSTCTNGWRRSRSVGRTTADSCASGATGGHTAPSLKEDLNDEPDNQLAPVWTWITPSFHRPRRCRAAWTRQNSFEDAGAGAIVMYSLFEEAVRLKKRVRRASCITRRPAMPRPTAICRVIRTSPVSWTATWNGSPRSNHCRFLWLPA